MCYEAGKVLRGGNKRPSEREVGGASEEEPGEAKACSSSRRRQRRRPTLKGKTAAPYNPGPSTVSYYITINLI